MVGKCTANNAQITQMTTAMSDLKSLMSGGPTQLAGMQEAQDKIKEGFDILAGKNTGPITLAYCQGYDETKVDGYHITNDTNPTPTSAAACVAAGGTWVEKEVENFNLHDELAKLNTSTSGLDFGTKIQDIKNKFADLVPDLNEKIKAVSPEAGNFAENFKMPEIPKAGTIVDICTCSDPLYSDQESCETNGGTWNCRKGPMPDIGSLFSGLSSGQLPTGNNAGIFSGLGIDMAALNKQTSGFFSGGLPSLNANSICKFCENIEVKDKVVTDPKTGKQTVEKAKEIPALNPKVAEEPPKIAPPSAPTSIDRKLGELQAINSFNRAVTLSLESYMLTFTGEKWNMPKKDAKRVIQVLQYYGWRDFAENVNADFDFVLKVMAIPTVANLTAEKIYAVWVMFYRDYVKKTITAAGIEKSEKKMYKIWEKMYNKITTSSYTFDVAALIAWNEALDAEGKTRSVVPKYSEPQKVEQNVAVVEEEESPPTEPTPTGRKSITLRGNVITYDNVTIQYNPNAGAFRMYFDDEPKVAYVQAFTQKDLDEVYSIFKAKSGTYVINSVDRNSGRDAKTTYTGETRSSKYEFVTPKPQTWSESQIQNGFAGAYNYKRKPYSFSR